MVVPLKDRPEVEGPAIIGSLSEVSGELRANGGDWPCVSGSLGPWPGFPARIRSLWRYVE
jgi:hypothetical protein